MKLGYVLHYVDDVAKTVAFYQQAFGLELGFSHDSGTYAEMATGATKLGFVAHAVASSHGFAYAAVSAAAKPPGAEIGFVVADVAAAYSKAVAAGAVAVAAPKTKPWGQTVSYVRDCNGFLVELCSEVG